MLFNVGVTGNEYKRKKYRSVPELFERCVFEIPDQIAIIHEGESITYHELNVRANQLASYLIKKGVGTDTFIALALTRSVEMIVAILAIFKAGGIYLPIDLNYPDQRIKYMLEDSGAFLLLTQSNYKHKFNGHHDKCLFLDLHKSKILQENDSNLLLQHPFGRCCYVIYTSGSTGKPKGVMGAENGLINRLEWMWDSYPFSVKEVGCVKTSISFIDSITEIFVPLLQGTKICLISNEVLKDLHLLTKELYQNSVTRIVLVPSLLELILKLPKDERSLLSQIELCIVSGERLSSHLCTAFYNTFPLSKLLNLYGSSEVSGDATFYEIKPQNSRMDLGSIIGYPVRNIEAYILDENLLAVENGQIGDLYISGIGLAAGYLNQPDLTAERFVPNPYLKQGDHNNDLSLRLYKTGDRACYLQDGNIVFKGRLDDQIKIRGFRIELGEIELAVEQHPFIDKAIVTGLNMDSGSHKLICYFKVNETIENTEILLNEIKSIIIKTLPEYMMPHHFVYLDNVPLLPNGKIDKFSLPAPDLSRRRDVGTFIEAKTKLQHDLADIWQMVLGINEISLDDSFFNLGGDSLAGMQIIAHVRTHFKVEIALQDLFKSATIHEMSVLIEDLIKQGQYTSIPLIPSAERSHPVPISKAQQRIWFSDQLVFDIALYNIYAIVTLKQFNIKAAQYAIHSIINRHESLRTSFKMIKGKMAQIILPNTEINMKENIVDLSNLSLDNKIKQLDEEILKQSKIRFDLAAPPLMRITFFVLSKNETVFLVVMHHIISDRWSMNIFFKEFFQFYTAYQTGKTFLPSSMNLDYADYTLWQNRYLKDIQIEKQLAYWKGELGNLSELLVLPTDKPRPKQLSYQFDSFNFRVDEVLKNNLKTFADHNQCSLFMVLLAAFNVFLYKYTHQKDITLGFPSANRPYKEIEGIIGFFVNNLPLRTVFGEENTYIDILNNIKKTLFNVLQNQDVYLDQIVDSLKIGHPINYNPIFQVEFSFESNKGEDIIIKSPYLVFDLKLVVIESNDNISLNFEYATDLFIHARIEQMAVLFSNVISDVIENPSQKIVNLNLRQDVQVNSLIQQSLGLTINNPKQFIHELFEESVEKYPNAQVFYKNETITFHDLNCKANRLAHYLKKKGIGAEAKVAIFLERSPWTLIAILAILKTGAAYIPIDIKTPTNRTLFILEDIQTPIILTTANDIDSIPVTFVQVICLDEQWSEIEFYSSKNLNLKVCEGNLAYVIYTSGTTGKPKGVMIEHENLLNYVQYAAKKYLIHRGPVFLHGSIAFDMSITSLFLPLIHGLTVHIIPEQDNLNTLVESFITTPNFGVLKITPSHLKVLNRLLGSRNIENHSGSIIIGGENLQYKDLIPISKRAPKIHFFNEYGPTETTVGSCVYKIMIDDTASNVDSIPIGKPCDNTQIYILDENLNLLPQGIVGEVFIGGEGVARGYLNQPDLTAEKFVPNPFANRLDHETSQRLYRTGDFARFRSDGNLEFYGRIDSQLKLRGYRIELGEIEAALNKHNRILQSLITVDEDENGNKKLIAYLVIDEIDEALDEATLQKMLSAELPEYMIPAYFICINNIPINQNGKIDYKALPKPEKNLYPTEVVTVPKSTLEKKLCVIWCQILKLNELSTTDNFFKLGGHSLLVVELISMIKNDLSITLTLRSIFEHPTIAELAFYIESQTHPASATQMIPSIPQKSFIPLSFAQQSLWFLSKITHGSLYNVPFCIKLKGKFDSLAFEKAWNALLERHEVLRTFFPSSMGQACQVIMPQLRINLKEFTVDLSSLSDEQKKQKIESIIKAQANQTFELHSCPLFSIKYLICAKDEHILVITLHHIISDEWSIGVLFKDLSTLYNAYHQSAENPLTPLPIQYSDFSIWQRDLLKENHLESQLKYWRDYLQEAPPFLELPFSKSRPETLTYAGSIYSHALPKSLCDAVHDLSQSSQCSLFMTLLAAFHVLIYRYTHQEDIVIGVPVANRHHQGTENLIGFFVNTLPIRLICHHDDKFSTLLSKIKETILHTYEYQDLPFDQIVDALNVPRDLNRNPLFQIVFEIEDTEVVQTNQWEDIDEIIHLPLATPTSKFDLTFSIVLSKEGFSINVEFSDDIYTKDYISQFTRHFENLLQNIISSPNTCISQFHLLDKTEKNQLLARWNQTDLNFQGGENIILSFENQVLKTPNKIAVTCDGNALTYEVLNANANKLAHALAKFDIGADTVICLYLDRSIEFLIAILGIFKSGAAYIPLDPSLPNERIRTIIDESRTGFILVDKGTKDKVNDLDLSDQKILRLEALIDSEINTNNINREINSKSLAYVIYTSGSTGKPKGAMIEHGGMINHLNCKIHDFKIDQDGVIAQTATQVFDVSVWQFLAALLVGGRTSIFTGERAWEPKQLLQLMHKEQVTIFETVPTHMQAILEELELHFEITNSFSSLKWIIVNGEALPSSICHRWFNIYPNIPMANAYGATECSDDTTHFKMFTSSKEYNGVMPIHGTIPNMKIYILDPNLEPVPFTVSGEIFFGGLGVGRGYLYNPAKTATSFIPNPFRLASELLLENSSRIYSTGDLGRYLQDGTIEYISRLDNQVKLRGFRIELGEIESVIAQHPLISQCVVIVREDKPKQKRLVAYVTTNKYDEKRTPHDLPEIITTHILGILPDYMVPSFIVVLKVFPLMHNGKVDRKQLPLPEEDFKKSNDFEAPRNAVEEALAEVWSSVLSIESISIHDNFFRLGGDSIISIQLASKARQRGLHFAIKDLFQAPTIAMLATRANLVNSTEKVDYILPSGEIFPTPIQNWFFERGFKDNNYYNQDLLLVTRENLDYELLTQAFLKVVQHHEAFHIRFTREKMEWKEQYQYSDMNKIIAKYCKTVKLNISSKESILESLISESQAAHKSLNIENGPLIKMILFDCGIEGQRLFIVAHHLIIDGVSWRILIDDLCFAYKEIKSGNPSVHFLRTGSYQHWSRSLGQYAYSEKFIKATQYWNSIALQDSSRLPVDFYKGDATVETLKTIRCTLDQKFTALLLQSVNQAYKTEINEILLTALILTLNEWTGRNEIVLDLEGHGRENIDDSIETFRTIGWFTSIYPISLSMQEDEDLSSLLKKTKEYLRSIPNKGIDYGILKYLNLAKKSENAPSAHFQESEICFNYLGQWDNLFEKNELFSQILESLIPSSADENKLSYKLEILAEVVAGSLSVNWLFSSNHYHDETINRLANNFIENLRKIITHCLQKENFGYTPLDFPLAKLMQKELDDVFHFNGIQDIYPLSSMQEGILFSTNYLPDSEIYFVQKIFEIKGALDHKKLQEAYQKVVLQHDVLRTGFAWLFLKKPMQYVVYDTQLPWSYEDWSVLSEIDVNNKLNDLLKIDKSYRYDLSKPVLSRMYLLKLAEARYYLVWSQHHIILDGWATSIVLRDLLLVYHNLRNNKTITFTDSKPYKDYISWLYSRREHVDEKSFWKNYLEGFEAPSYITKRIVVNSQIQSYADYSFKLSRNELQSLRKIAENYNLTLNTIFQGIWSIFLHFYLNSTDLMFGITVSGRSIELEEVHNITGILINTLPLRVVLRNDETVLSLLQELQTQTILLNQYGHSSLAEVQSLARVQNFSSKNQFFSLFDHFFVFENFPVDDSLISNEIGISIEEIAGTSRSEYPLTVTIMPGKEMEVILTCADEAFLPFEIEVMLKGVQNIMQSIIQKPEQKISELSLQSEEEEKIMFSNLNLNKVENKIEKSIVEFFEAQALNTPNAIAIVYEGEQISYSELNAHANQMAHYLKQHLASAESIISICMERSIELIIGILGILKSGNAYVPLDPYYPTGRLSHMLEDSQSIMLLTTSHFKERFLQYPGKIIYLNTVQDELRQGLRTNPNIKIRLNSLAYVIYTSGSTGKPKGVMVEHKSLISSTLARKEYYKDKNPNFLLLSSIAFDSSAAVLYGTFLQGGTLTLPKQEERIDIDLIIRTISTQKATHLLCVPSLYYLLLKESEKSALSSLKVVIVAGENCPTSLPSAHRKTLPGCALYNEYGPTEATIWSTVENLTDYDDSQSSPLSIGRPIANTKVYIVDRYSKLLPIGIPGEIVLGGTSIARGYLSSPQLSTEKFVTNPLIESGIERLYKTGDIGRYLPDGRVEFLGRIDDQVKIRGYRVELPEIEAALLSHSDVLQSVVIVREDNPDQKQLVAYIVPSEFKPISIELIQFLEETLPDYMIPAVFVFIDQMPLTPTGKIDKNALPTPEKEETRKDIIGPRNEIEIKLSLIWREILNLTEISMHDNFIALGGHSLLATQLISRIRKEFEIDMPLRTLFEEPTIEKLASKIKDSSSTKVQPVVRMQRPKKIPLSFSQQRLWFIEQLLPNNDLYHIYSALRLKGHLEIHALEKAFLMIIERHEILRTRIDGVEAEEGLQVVENNTSFMINFKDLSFEAESNKEKVLSTITKEEIARPFNLSETPLIRVLLIRIKEDEHLFLVTVHHIISDGWSMKIMFNELATLYNAICEGKDALLPSLDIQYIDYTLWQRDLMQGDFQKKQLKYWKKHLKEAPELLELSITKRRPKELNYKAALYEQRLSNHLLESLKQLAQRNNASLFMVLLAGFQILLYRYTGLEDIVIGSPIANRHYQEIENLIGLFVNTLALRLKGSGQESFVELLSRIKETTLASYEYQDLPFEQLVDQLKVSRDLNRNPIFQIMFIMQNASDNQFPNLLNLDISEFELNQRNTNFDLTLSVHEDFNGLKFSYEYALDLFEPHIIQQLANHYENILNSIVVSPEKPIKDLKLLASDELNRITKMWNRTAVEYPNQKLVHELFEEQALKTPENIAVVFADKCFTYDELNKYSNKLAHYLSKKGVKPRSLVGIHLERSLELVISILAVLKIGCAYVPLDPEYPKKRLKFMMEEIGNGILLTQRHLMTEWLDHKAADFIIALDEIWKDLEHEESQNLPISIHSEDLIYVIYTSGSTGRPKGVENSHKGLTNRLLWMQDQYSITSTDRILHKTPYSFDVSVWEIILPIISGATLCVAEPNLHQDAEGLLKFIKTNKITHTHFVPSMLNMFLEVPFSDECTSLRMVFASGEALSIELQWKFFDKLPDVELHNLYGPTEAAIEVTYWKCEKNSTLSCVPIGRPIWNTQIYILDDNMKPVPKGVEGNIFIGGVNLARGYLNRPDLTAVKFVPNPLLSEEERYIESSLRLYNTGDKGKYIQEGIVEFLGRSDDQLKINGHRIELQEIEILLMQHENVSQTIVNVYEENRNKLLVAYIVIKNSSEAHIQLEIILKEHLSKFLPEYMVPKFYVFLDKMPLTVSGKINKKELPAPDRRISADEYMEPRDPLEKMLAAIWMKILNVSRVGIQDNFFKLGGDSINCIQVVSSARKNNLHLKVKDIFQYPTLLMLAEHLRSHQKPYAVPDQNLVTGNIPLTPIQRQFFEKNLSNTHHYNQSLLVKCNRRLKNSQLEKALFLLVQHHDALRAQFDFNDQKWQQFYFEMDRFGARKILEIVDLTHIEEVNLALELECHANKFQSSLNICNGPIFRFVLFQTKPNIPQRFLFIIHHLVVDQVSWRILLEDLQFCYEASSINNCLPYKTHSYQYWANALLSYANKLQMQEVDYWTQINRGINPVIPIDFESEVNIEGDTYTIQDSLPHEKSQALLTHVLNRHNIKINDLLITALVLVMGDWKGSYDLHFDCESHGREDIIEGIDISRTIGWFTAIFPVAIELSSHKDLEASLTYVRNYMQAIPVNGIGYGILRYLTTQENIKNELCPKVIFNYLGQWSLSQDRDQLFAFSNESTGHHSNSSNRRNYYLEINCYIEDGQFNITWTYSKKMYYEKTIKMLSKLFLDRLEQLILHCTSNTVKTHSVSDFKLDDLTEIEMESLISKYGINDQK